MKPKPTSESRVVKTAIVLPPGTNNRGTISTDSVDFLHPFRSNHAICLESFVTWIHKTSMEVFVKVEGGGFENRETNCL